MFHREAGSVAGVSIDGDEPHGAQCTACGTSGQPTNGD